MLQLLFITDAQRRRIHSTSHETKKPGRQVVTFLLLCNITMWIVYTFEVQKVKDSPVQVGSGNVNKDILTAVDFGAIFFSAEILRVLCLVNDPKGLPATVHFLQIPLLCYSSGDLEEFLQDQTNGLNTQSKDQYL